MRWFGRVAGLLVVVLALLAGAAQALGHGHGHGHDKTPKRVLILVLDQFRPVYVDRFDMPNVRSLMRGGVNFPHARLGHMASETVISHNVITSGRRPGRMGWSDEAYRDSDNVLGAGKDSMWVSGSLTRDQFNALITHGGYPKLADYLHAAHPGTKFMPPGRRTTRSTPRTAPPATSRSRSRAATRTATAPASTSAARPVTTSPTTSPSRPAAASTSTPTRR